MHQATQTVAKTPVPKEEEGMGPNSLPSVAGQQALEHKRAREVPSQSSPPHSFCAYKGFSRPCETQMSRFSIPHPVSAR